MSTSPMAVLSYCVSRAWVVSVVVVVVVVVVVDRREGGSPEEEERRRRRRGVSERLPARVRISQPRWEDGGVRDLVAVRCRHVEE